MSNPFFDHPILNSPYTCPKRHWALDDQRQPAQASRHSDTSRLLDKSKSDRIAVKVINHLGDEVMKVFKVI